MTELMELVDVALIDDATDETKCPFCQEKPIGHDATGPKEVSDKVKSVPKDLKCDNAKSWNSGASPKRNDGDLQYTVAQHHLISANQCYAKIKRLVRMGNLAEYDINCKENGIGLPTTHHSIKYPYHGRNVKYGELDDNGKDYVSHTLMRELGAQWHVGHHSFAIAKDYDTHKEAGIDESDENDIPHETSYDQQIISRLFNLCKAFEPNFCEEKDKDEKFKEAMDKISKEIKSKLEKFKGGDKAKPAESYPFFVSKRAYDFSGCAKHLPHKEAQQNTEDFGLE